MRVLSATQIEPRLFRPSFLDIETGSYTVTGRLKTRFTNETLLPKIMKHDTKVAEIAASLRKSMDDWWERHRASTLQGDRNKTRP